MYMVTVPTNALLMGVFAFTLSSTYVFLTSAQRHQSGCVIKSTVQAVVVVSTDWGRCCDALSSNDGTPTLYIERCLIVLVPSIRAKNGDKNIRHRSSRLPHAHFCALSVRDSLKGTWRHHFVSRKSFR